jgi:CPA2 family monovalent cation:H+ antiporter-2
VFQLLLSASVMTLLLTPFLIHHSGAIAGLAKSVVSRFTAVSSAALISPADRMTDHIIVVGFGPAGQQVVQDLWSHGVPVLVIDLNPKTAASTSPELPIEYGDATQPEILEHARVGDARAAVVTVPDPLTARLIISQVRKLAKPIPIIARGRHHIHQQSLIEAGSDHVVNEEMLVGKQLARETLATLALHRATEEYDPR